MLVISKMQVGLKFDGMLTEAVVAAADGLARAIGKVGILVKACH